MVYSNIMSFINYHCTVPLSTLDSRLNSHNRLQNLVKNGKTIVGTARRDDMKLEPTRNNDDNFRTDS